jgi:hypothetical protein
MDAFGNLLNEHDQRIVNHILSRFQTVSLPDSMPDISDIKNYVNIVAAANQKIPEIQNIAFGLESIKSLEDPILKSALYSLGSSLFKLTIRGDIPDDNIKTAKTFLEWSIKIDDAYYEAYNHLGDCWMRIVGGFEKAVSCYKAALTTVEQEGILTDPEFKKFFNNFIGDNFFKIGICLIKLNRKNDAELFLTLAHTIVSTDYQGFHDMGLKSWDQVFALLPRLP